jgi:hypothetical protein
MVAGTAFFLVSQLAICGHWRPAGAAQMLAGEPAHAAGR